MPGFRFPGRMTHFYANEEQRDICVYSDYVFHARGR